MEVVFLILGLAGLWLGAELAISGVLNIAERHKISRVFLGLTILAFGTDLPELFIDISAAIRKLQGTETSGLIVGETIGTCISQITLVLGIAAFFGIFIITKRELLRDGFIMLVSVLFLFVAGIDGEISRTEGVILMLFYGVYFFTLLREEKLFEKMRAPQYHLLWALLSMVSGFILLIFASHLTIENALLLSEKFGIAQHLVGILIVGLGTSLPELATSITALRKGAGTMAAGNLIGSNIFDALFTLGIGSAIAGFNFNTSLLWIDLPILFFVSILVLLLFRFRNQMRIGKKEGVILLGVYVIYFIIRASGIFI
jgi:cation:H+ antiporter